ncbi:MAG: 5'/3'-nucleotidase SurE [Firmicutes bacterium]|nr:5'/3'-nucleotidase SurE [Bacillota bacterium]
MKVLLTNDDGFYAPGLQTLYRYLKDTAIVFIVAPQTEISASGHGITMHRPLRPEPVSAIGEDTDAHWSVDGTPADCVKLAIEHIFRNSLPDLIISGINRGPNLGNDILYSGTVSAAIEGAMHKIPSLAVSLAQYSNPDFKPAAAFIAQKITQLAGLAKTAVLNLNFPPLNDFHGVRFTRLGNRVYRNVFEARVDPRGRNYFWMGGEPAAVPQSADSDIQAVAEGYISITPLSFDLTDWFFLEKIRLNPNPLG